MPRVLSGSALLRPLVALLLSTLLLSAPASAQRLFADAFEPLALCQQNLSEAPVSAQATAGTAFFGQPARLPPGAAPVHAIESFEDYRERFALPGDLSGRANGSIGSGGVPELTGDNVLAWSVYLFFENGGRRAWVIPTAGPVPEWYELELIDPIGAIELLVVPALSSLGDDVERGAASARLQQYVDRRLPVQDRYLLADLPQGWTTAQLPPATPRPPLDLVSRNAALYHPWLRVQSVLPGGGGIGQPPAGAVAGILARVDGLRGVWEAPAGIGAEVRGILGLDQMFNTTQGEAFNFQHVNLIRQFVPGDALVWGARTRALGDAEWRYVNVRRLAMMIERSIHQGTRFVAFETNHPTLWSRLANRIEDFMHDLYVAGAFAGSTAEEAYLVRVDSSTTTADDIQRGIVRMLFGFAPLQASEFIVKLLPQRVGICP